MSYTHRDNSAKVMMDIDVKASLFIREMLNVVHQRARPITPKDTGRLSIDVIKQVLGLHGKIRWQKQYASVQERGSRRDGSYKIRHYSTAGTGPHFALRAVKAALKNSKQIARKVKLT